MYVCKYAYTALEAAMPQRKKGGTTRNEKGEETVWIASSILYCTLLTANDMESAVSTGMTVR